MVPDEFSPGVPQLAILLAVIVAPIAEELIFRGVIQSWLVSRAASVLNGKSPSSSRGPTLNSPISLSQPGPPRAVPDSLEKLAAPAGRTPPPERSTRRLSRKNSRHTWRPGPSLHAARQAAIVEPSCPRRAAAFFGVTITSLIFAALHFDQWPAPIALFLLSVVDRLRVPTNR